MMVGQRRVRRRGRGATKVKGRHGGRATRLRVEWGGEAWRRVRQVKMGKPRKEKRGEVKKEDRRQRRSNIEGWSRFGFSCRNWELGIGEKNKEMEMQGISRGVNLDPQTRILAGTAPVWGLVDEDFFPSGMGTRINIPPWAW